VGSKEEIEGFTFPEDLEWRVKKVHWVAESEVLHPVDASPRGHVRAKVHKGPPHNEDTLVVVVAIISSQGVVRLRKPNGRIHSVNCNLGFRIQVFMALLSRR
jgi:hypothetical protein